MHRLKTIFFYYYMKNITLLLKPTLLVALLFFTFGLYAQNIKGDGVVKTEVLDLKNFNHIVAKGEFKLFLNKANEDEVKITADQNIIPIFQCIQKGEQLLIIMEADIKKYKDLSVYISCKNIKQIDLQKNIEARINQNFDFEDLHIFVNEYSLLKANMKISNFILFASDNAFVELSGEAKNVEINAHDDAEVEAFAMGVDKAKIFTTGYSEVKINCKKDLQIKVSGQSSLYYTGNAKISERFFSSSGFVIKRKTKTNN